MAGLTPKTADEIHYQVGTLLRQFVDLKERISQQQASLAPLVLTDPPYEMPSEDETLLKSAINQLDTELDAMDMTFVNRLVGLW